MRRVAVPIILVLGALVVWFAPSSRSITAVHQGQQTELSAACAAAPVDLFRYGLTPDTEPTWYVTADGATVFAPENPCRPSAWWRTVLGGVLITAGAFLLLSERERVRERTEPVSV